MNINSPAATIAILWRDIDSFPAISMNGIISTLGNIVSNCVSISVESGNISFMFSSIGVIARPGRFTTSESDRIATTEVSDNGVFPVMIVIALCVFVHIYAIRARVPEMVNSRLNFSF